MLLLAISYSGVDFQSPGDWSQSSLVVKLQWRGVMTVEVLWETLLLGAERGVEKKTLQQYILDTFTFFFLREIF